MLHLHARLVRHAITTGLRWLADSQLRQQANQRRIADLDALLLDQKDVYHLDVKPSNILFDQKGTPYLSDFGLALTDDEVGSVDAARGTPAYMSPEQVLADGGGIHGGTDSYCLGAVFYELLTGRQPFRADSYSKLLRRAESPKRPRLPRQIAPTLPKQLEGICRRAMSPDIDKRYSSAKDFGDALRLWLRDCDEPARVIGDGHLEVEHFWLEG